MAKIICNKGMEGQNNLSSIKGIEIDLLNGQKALIYPRYALKKMLSLEQISKWDAVSMNEIEALKVTETAFATECLRNIDSPAAQWVSQFKSDKYSNFALPSLLAAMEIRHQKKEIDALAETIEGADLLKNYTPYISSCSRCSEESYWYVVGYGGYADGERVDFSNLVVPTIIY